MKLTFVEQPTAHLLSLPDVGSKIWWQQIEQMGLPLLEESPSAAGNVVLTFIWRDPQGSEATSNIAAVYVDVNCVTDHHSFSPQSLGRIAGTDVWTWQVEVEADWRGSYSFIPVPAEYLPPQQNADPNVAKMAQRSWWRSLIPLAEYDPLNKITPRACNWGVRASAVHLPASPEQTAWANFDERNQCLAYGKNLQRSGVQKMLWPSQALKNRREVWVYSTGNEVGSTNLDVTDNAGKVAASESAAERPLVILLDGRFWAEDMPIFSALDAQTASGLLPPSVYVMVDSINRECREREMACSPAFWQALQTELLPQVAPLATHSQLPSRTVVAGQSFGGLAAMYAGLTWPERFGCVLSQSGSFWWPNLGLMKQGAITTENLNQEPVGWLTQQVENGLVVKGDLNIVQQVGRRETVLLAVNQRLHQALKYEGHNAQYQTYAGGHDYLCWRGGLIDGLTLLLAKSA